MATTGRASLRVVTAVELQMSLCLRAITSVATLMVVEYHPISSHHVPCRAYNHQHPLFMRGRREKGSTKFSLRREKIFYASVRPQTWIETQYRIFL
jgi:hypothetical protein